MARSVNAWFDYAACMGMDVEVFFPEDADDPEAAEVIAKGICSRCKVKQVCLEYAISKDTRFGVFGGLNHKERTAYAAD